MRASESAAGTDRKRLAQSGRSAREAGSKGATSGLRWLYLVAFMPTLTDLIEHGGLPDSPLGWLTELVGGMIVLALVHRVLMQYRNVLELARSDGLTGLLNRRVFDEIVQDECARAQRFGQALSLVYIDVDDFKQINDRLGHKEGDQVLRRLAAVIQCTIRSHIDRGFRLGGDEFALLLPGSDTAHARAVVGRIREAFEMSNPRSAGQARRRISAGVVQLRPGEATTDLVQRADVEMYRQKRARRSPQDRGVSSQSRPGPADARRSGVRQGTGPQRVQAAGQSDQEDPTPAEPA
jgi:diguanylate cyclase (GGDEF)-like protein